MSTQPSAPAMGGSEWLLLLLLSLLWGCSFFYLKVLVAELPPLTVVFIRLALAAVLLNLFVLMKGESMPRSARLWREFAVMGLLNNIVPFTLITWAETSISSGLASILNATTPIFAVLAAQFLTRGEKLNWHKGFGVAFGFFGVIVLIGPSVLRDLGGAEIGGELACLLAAVSYAFAGIYGRRFKGVASIKVAAGQISASAVFMLPVMLFVDRPWQLAPPSIHAWQALIGLATLSTALAYVIYFRILATAGATNVLLVTFLVPVSAILLGVTFLHETITVLTLVGMALIGVGLAAIDGRLPSMIGRKRMTS